MEEATETARSAAPRFALFEAEAHEGHQIGRLGGRGGIEETRAKGRDRERLGVPTEAEVIRGPQRPSAVLSGHQRSSEVLRGYQRPSAVLSGHQRSSEVLRGHQRLSEAISRPRPSHLGVIDGDDAPSAHEAIGDRGGLEVGISAQVAKWTVGPVDVYIGEEGRAA
jgi:hypothetical protein